MAGIYSEYFGVYAEMRFGVYGDAELVRAGSGGGAGPTVNEGKTRKWFRDGYLKRLGVV